MRDKEGYNKESYVIKNGHIYCTKYTYENSQIKLQHQSTIT